MKSSNKQQGYFMYEKFMNQEKGPRSFTQVLSRSFYLCPALDMHWYVPVPRGCFEPVFRPHKYGIVQPGSNGSKEEQLHLRFLKI